MHHPFVDGNQRMATSPIWSLGGAVWLWGLTGAEPLGNSDRYHSHKRTIHRIIHRALNKFIVERLMSHISANDLKTKGISAIELALSTSSEAVVQVRGKDRFVVMGLAHYHHLRECELEAALAQTRADLAAGRAVKESAEAHLARLDAM